MKETLSDVSVSYPACKMFIPHAGPHCREVELDPCRVSACTSHYDQSAYTFPLEETAFEVLLEILQP